MPRRRPRSPQALQALQTEPSKSTGDVKRNSDTPRRMSEPVDSITIAESFIALLDTSAQCASSDDFKDELRQVFEDDVQRRAFLQAWRDWRASNNQLPAVINENTNTIPNIEDSGDSKPKIIRITSENTARPQRPRAKTLQGKSEVGSTPVTQQPSGWSAHGNRAKGSAEQQFPALPKSPKKQPSYPSNWNTGTSKAHQGQESVWRSQSPSTDSSKEQDPLEKEEATSDEGSKRYKKTKQKLVIDWF